jgi:hypothetical protein
LLFNVPLQGVRLTCKTDLSDTAGIHFVVSTPDSALSQEDRRSVRSHAQKVHGKRRKAIQLRSWISSEDDSGHVKTANLTRPFLHSVTTLRRIDGDFSALQLPTGIEPAMIQELVKRTHPKPAPRLISSSM